MRLEVERNRLKIIPESPVDEAFIELALRLWKDGDSVQLVRRNAMGLSSLAFLEARQRAVVEGGVMEIQGGGERRAALEAEE